MIQQHLLQQQRLNHNHERLLERYNRILTPGISEFRPFGASTLPGRDYDQHLESLQGNTRRRNSLVGQSRASVGSSSETYRLMGGAGTTETLPKNVNKVMQHSRHQSVPLVHAEKFEPVHFYEHPKYGVTPAYLRPVVDKNSQSNKINDNDSEKNEDSDEEKEEEKNLDVRSHTSVTGNKTSDDNGDDDDDDETIKPPLGYITYKDWKKKYENLIPVNPLLFSIYTKRSNGSINKYGQSFYASPPHRHHHRSSNFDDDDHGDSFTPTLSGIESITSDIPQGTSLSSQQKYNRLQPQVPSKTAISRPLQPIHPVESDSSDEESTPPNSPIPFISRQKDNFPISTPITSSINKPIADQTEKSNVEAAVGKVNIPPAPPMPPSLAPSTSSSATRYEKPASVSNNSIPIAPPIPNYLKSPMSANSHPVLSNTSVSESSPPADTGPTTITPGSKAVTFGGASSSLTKADVVSSSSDSEDEEKQKRRRRRKRQSAGENNDDSSSDD